MMTFVLIKDDIKLHSLELQSQISLHRGGSSRIELNKSSKLNNIVNIQTLCR